MKYGFCFICAALVSLNLFLSYEAQAISPSECSARYRQAKQDNQLNGQSWSAFRQQNCASGDEAQTQPAAANAPTAAANTPTAAANNEQNSPASIAKPQDAATSPAVFPEAIASKFANEKPGRQRELTCLEQYNANKASHANGGLKWIEAGGGYYSQCNKHLKGGK
jgi:hypothetical protein